MRSLDQKQRFQTFAMLENGVRYSKVASHLTVSQLTTSQLPIPLGDWDRLRYFSLFYGPSLDLPYDY